MTENSGEGEPERISFHGQQDGIFEPVGTKVNKEDEEEDEEDDEWAELHPIHKGLENSGFAGIDRVLSPSDAEELGEKMVENDVSWDEVSFTIESTVDERTKVSFNNGNIDLGEMEVELNAELKNEGWAGYKGELGVPNMKSSNEAPNMSALTPDNDPFMTIPTPDKDPLSDDESMSKPQELIECVRDSCGEQTSEYVEGDEGEKYCSLECLWEAYDD